MHGSQRGTQQADTTFGRSLFGGPDPLLEFEVMFVLRLRCHAQKGVVLVILQQALALTRVNSHTTHATLTPLSCHFLTPNSPWFWEYGREEASHEDRKDAAVAQQQTTKLNAILEGTRKLARALINTQR